MAAASDNQPDQSTKTRHRIEGVDWWSILPFAGLFDLISLIPAANMPNSIIGQSIMFLIFLSKGVNVLGKKTWPWYLITWVVEFIPLVSMLPMFLLSSSRYIALSRIEDKIKQLGVDNERAKTYVRRVLKTKGMQEEIKKMQDEAVVKAGMKGRTDNDKYGRDARREKREQIEARRGDLDKSLERDPNAGVKRGISNLAKGQPGFVDKRAPGEAPRSSTPAAANDNEPGEMDKTG